MPLRHRVGVAQERYPASLGNQTLGKKEGLGNRLGRKCTLRNVISVNYLPANAGLEDFYILHSGCTLISGKRLTV